MYISFYELECVNNMCAFSKMVCNSMSNNPDFICPLPFFEFSKQNIVTDSTQNYDT